jgi:hypothetical protein
MPRYLVERSFPAGLGAFLADKPIGALVEANEDAGVVWLHSYVTDDPRRVFCLCDAASPEAIRKAARRAGLPVDTIHRVTVLDPHAYRHEQL